MLFKGEANEGRPNSLPSLGKGGLGWNGEISNTENPELETIFDCAPFSLNPSFPEGRRGSKQIS